MNELYNEICVRWVEYCEMLDETIKVTATVRRQKYFVLLGMIRAYQIVSGQTLELDPVNNTVTVKGE